MAQCSLCGKETSLFDAGVPVCLDCANRIEENRRKPAEREARPDTDKSKQAYAKQI